MAVARSSFDDVANPDPVDDKAIIELMHAIQAGIPAYGYRRIAA